LRIAVVSPFVDRRHGTERALAELLERLAGKYGCEIHLFAQRVEDFAVQKPVGPNRPKTNVIYWHRIPACFGPHLAQFTGWIFLNTLIRRWLRVFSGYDFDLVLSPGINCLDADVVIAHAVFHRLRELAAEAQRRTHADGGFLRSLHRRAYYATVAALERRIYHNRRIALAAVSEHTAHLLEKYFQRDDVLVIANGVDTAQFSSAARLAARALARRHRGYRDSDFVLLLIGNDWRVKGLPTLLAAVAARPGLPTRMLVVGDDAVDEFSAVAQRLGVLQRCRWEGTRADVLDYYAAADAYVSPSREDSFGLPVAEAMACGLPVITSSQAGVAAFIRDTIDGYVLRDPDDVEGLAAMLEHLYLEDGLRDRVGTAAEAAVQGWTWDRNAEAVWKFLTLAVAKIHHAPYAEEIQ
jgi:UDP-glucose:(heptosyl)LPS alpha-1,3-glucosyltransferase